MPQFLRNKRREVALDQLNAIFIEIFYADLVNVIGGLGLVVAYVTHISGVAQHLTDFDARPFHIALTILIPKARKLVADQTLPVASGVHIKYKANDFCLLLVDDVGVMSLI